MRSVRKLATLDTDRTHHGLEEAMTDVARSKDPSESFAYVALATREYIDYCGDAVFDTLAREYSRNFTHGTWRHEDMKPKRFETRNT